jgi:hypothetical protein
MNIVEKKYFKYENISNHQIDVNKQNLIQSIKLCKIPNLNSYRHQIRI